MAEGTVVLSTHLTEAQWAAFEAKTRAAGMAPEETLRILALRYIDAGRLDAGGRMPVVKMTDAPAALRRRLDRDVYSALLAMCATENGHDPSAVERWLKAKDALLQSAGLLRQFQPAKDQTWAQALARLTREPIVDFASEPVQTKTTCAL